MSRIRVGLIFGGRSVEHEVSLVSAKAVLDHLDPDLYEVVPIGVTQEGRWLTSGDARGLLDTGIRSASASTVTLPADPSIRGIVTLGNHHPASGLDVVFPLIHGTGGEDGCLQGLLELADLPYVGSGVLGSSLGMDKIAMKTAFRAANLPCADFLGVSRHRIETDPDRIGKEVDERIGYPCFTKPANGGSSVGISKVDDRSMLEGALAEAARYDRRVLIETGIDGQEVECAVLGNDEPQASTVGEIVPCHEFYDYEAKYLVEGSELIIPARIDEEQKDRVRSMSITAFQAVDAAGMARVDFFVRRSDGKVLINEINTIPGFTPISMYPRLWEASGIGFGELVDKLIGLAMERHEARTKTMTVYRPGRGIPGER